MDYHDPNAPDVLNLRTRQVAETFDYTDEDWIEIKKSICHLRPDEAVLNNIRARLCHNARTYLLAVYNRRDEVVKIKRHRKHLARIAKLSDDLVFTLARLEGEVAPKAIGKMFQILYGKRDQLGAPEGTSEAKQDAPEYRESKSALIKLRVFAEHLLGKFDDELPKFPKVSPRGWFEFHVLEIWTELGGQLQMSRQPRTGKITGPLARYFAAATGPLPIRRSLENLPDILHRQKVNAAARHQRTRLR